MKKVYFILAFISLQLLNVNNSFSQNSINNRFGSWGDQGNGTYINPVLNADYSDPDVIRVNNDFYMVCSEFHFMGIPILHSKDLVNWTIIGRLYDEFKFDPKYDTNEKYAEGSWAPSISYHDKKFRVYFCTPKEGLFMTSAERPEGPWAPLIQVVQISGWEDPCPFWDENGQAYLGHSRVGAGPIIIHKLSADGKKLLDDGVTVYTGPVAEGTKIYKLNGYYYLSIPEGGVGTGWQTILRSKNIFGPYEKKVVLETGLTGINGPHLSAPQTSDEFNDQSLSFQWSWNHNPVREAWSLSSNPGFLALNGLPAGNFLKAKNTLTQKIMGDEGEATTLLLTTEMGNGQKAGLCVMGKQYNLIGIEKVNGKLTLFVNINGKNSTQTFRSSKVYLKVKVTTKEGGNQFFYSTDNKTFQPSGDTFSASNGYWKGPKTGLFSYNETGEGGKALFNWFHYLYYGPKSE